ncbi:MAG: hypothetical protein HC781_01575 [Leptolyngbyaceae cyanobacterium CSU_1_4]|nr:hypothetical protein [Leptolyngbyaceae cyanobacterium CSU_1_4]
MSPQFGSCHSPTNPLPGCPSGPGHPEAKYFADLMNHLIAAGLFLNLREFLEQEFSEATANQALPAAQPPVQQGSDEERAEAIAAQNAEPVFSEVVRTVTKAGDLLPRSGTLNLRDSRGSNVRSSVCHQGSDRPKT